MTPLRISMLVTAVVAFAFAALWLGQRRWDAAVAEMVARLHGLAAADVTATISMRELQGLPAPVVRYFARVLREGQPIPHVVRIVWSGEFNMGTPDRENWMYFTATQHVVTKPPGFVWSARIAMAPGIAALVRDGVVDGRGSMQASVMSVYTIVNAVGSDLLTRAALQRYLGEAVWYPTALLPSQGVQWTAIDDRHARATLNAAGTTASLDVEFGPDDLIRSVYAPDRLYDDGRSPPVPRPWRATNVRYGEVSGLVVPVESYVEWELANGRFQYWRGTPLAIEHVTSHLPLHGAAQAKRGGAKEQVR